MMHLAQSWRPGIRSITLVLIFAMTLLYTGTQQLPQAHAANLAPAATTGFVTRSGFQLMLNGRTYRFAGANSEQIHLTYGGLVYASQYSIDDFMATVSEMGLSMVRNFGLGSTGCALCAEPSLGVFNENMLRQVDYIVKSAGDHGIRLLLPFGACGANYWDGSTKEMYAHWLGLSSNTDFYTNATALQDYEHRINLILNRVNTYTGVAYKNDPTIALWEICGEPTDNPASAYIPWITSVANYIKSIDTHHLVEDDNSINGTFSAAEYNVTNIDAYDPMHPYDHPNDVNRVLTEANNAKTHNKAFILGEWGWDSRFQPTTSYLQNYTTGLEGDNAVAGDLFWELENHIDTYGYLVQHPELGEDPQYNLYYPGLNDDMRARAQILRTHGYTMSGQTVPTHAALSAPLITSVNGEQIAWRGVAGARYYSVERSTAGKGGPWTVICNECATDQDTPWTDSTQPSGNVWYRVRGYNLDNVAGPYSPVYGPNATTTTTIDDSTQGTNQNQFNYQGSGWQHATGYTGYGYYNDSVSYSNVTNDAVFVQFTGTQIKLYGGVNTSQGIGAVSIDGSAETDVDFYANSTDTGNVLLWTSPTLAPTTHMLKLRVTGLKNANATDYNIAPDRVDIIGGQPAPSITTVDDNTTGSGTNQFNYQGSGWRNATGQPAPYYNGTVHWSNVTNDTATITFVGTQLVLYSSTADVNGIAEISLDGNVVTQLSAYSYQDWYSADGTTGDVQLWQSPLLPSGTHTLKVRITGTKYSSSSDYNFSIDRVDIVG